MYCSKLKVVFLRHTSLMNSKYPVFCFRNMYFIKFIICDTALVIGKTLALVFGRRVITYFVISRNNQFLYKVSYLAVIIK